MPDNDNSQQLKYLRDLSSGKATEALQMRFNPREFEILNQAFACARGFRSRHAWLHDVLMREARDLLEQEGLRLDPKTNLPSEE